MKYILHDCSGKEGYIIFALFIRRIGGVVSIAFGIFATLEASRLYTYGTGILIGDHAFPAIIGIILIVAGLFYLCLPYKEEKVVMPNHKQLKTMIYTIGILCLYCFSMNYLGYFVTTFIAFLLLLKVIGNYRWVWTMALALIFTAVMYYLFITLLKTPLPITPILSF
ncbi:tripartite tricarboxylate transporter TctB family protein [Caldifermentibacillus hisashii]|uniref:tripartite tricarboxylate transporter TctB family protein n=1 Tax=Caldifermentibacillus hisashii TaxID=996558 RepID=UPI002E200DE0|nr:tripartite tricarboxylate transporter TctB family protein [Caldifermentibacillus hisashii]